LRRMRRFNLKKPPCQGKSWEYCKHSVTGGGDKSCCGLGVRAVREGSIGRDRLRPEPEALPPQREAGGLGPRPFPGEITAS
jgi:hypothetical protein